MFYNCLQHTIHIVEYFFVSKPYRCNSMIADKRITFTVIFARLIGRVNFSIQFYSEFFFWTVEVHNKWTNTLLSAKFTSEQLTVLRCNHNFFSVGVALLRSVWRFSFCFFGLKNCSFGVFIHCSYFTTPNNYFLTHLSHHFPSS